MRTTLDSPVPIATVAAEAGVTTRQLERLFGTGLGVTPRRHYLELRLDRARSLLLQTERSIIEVAVASGFGSAGHFTRAYRKRYGITPGEQRARLG